MKKICTRYDIKIKTLFVYHSKTNDQIENVIKIMKNYLRFYVNYAQDN